MDLIEKLKTNSSKWIKTKGSFYEKFYWQRGYAGFSVNEKQLDRVKHYIANQDKHHKTIPFEDEYLSFLREYNIDFDERYVWD